MATETPEQKIARLEQELAESKTIITDQAEALSNAEAAQAEEKTIVVTHEGQKYRVLGKQFKIKGDVVKAADLAKNKEAVQHLIDTKSELLQPIVAKVTKGKAGAAADTEGEA